MLTQGRLDYNWFYSLKILAHLRSKVLVDFLHYVTRINCLTGAIISETHTTNKYIYIPKYNPPQKLFFLQISINLSLNRIKFWKSTAPHTWAVGTANLTFFLENEVYRPLTGAKLKSKTHLQNTFFDFWAVFCAFGFKVFKKCLYNPKNYFLKKTKKV
jgi:hypothetical protein